MLKHLTIRNLGLSLFILAVITHFYIDFSQVDYLKGDPFRIFYVFTGRNIVQILMGLSFSCFSIGWFSTITIGWSAYHLENIYYRIFHDSVYDLHNWVVSVSSIVVVVLIIIIKRWMKK